MPTDSQAFITEYKGQQIEGNPRSIYLMQTTVLGLTTSIGLVEQVKDGSTLRIRLLLPDGDHQFVNIALAGVRCARVASRPGDTSEPWGEEVSHARARVMRAVVHVIVVGVLVAHRQSSSQSRDCCSDTSACSSCLYRMPLPRHFRQARTLQLRHPRRSTLEQVRSASILSSSKFLTVTVACLTFTLRSPTSSR